jgi:hypothetical protein
MPIKDAEAVKRKILDFLGNSGPSLPVHIAREIGLDMIFTSAFLSELISHEKIKASEMKIGTSPVYFIPGNEEGLEKFSDFLKGKERETFNLLKKEEFLVDSEQEPAIKIALRSLKDFAKPFERNGKLIWRYFTVGETEYGKSACTKEEAAPENTSEVYNTGPEIDKEPEIKAKFVTSDKKETEPKKEQGLPKKRPQKKKAKIAGKEKDDRFFNKVKEFLSKDGSEMTDIIGFSKKDFTIKAKKGGKEYLIVAYNKKKITDKDILNAYKKSEDYGLDYSVLSMGDIPKKVKNFMDAVKNIDSIGKIE